MLRVGGGHMIVWRNLVLLSLLAIPATPGAAQTLASAEDRREALIAYRTGQEWLSSEQWEKAIAAFDRAVALDRLFTDAHYGRGQAFVALRRYTSAIQAYGRCLEAARDLHGLRDKDRLEADNRLNDLLFELRDTLRRMRAQGGRELRATQLEDRIRDLERSRSAAQGPFQAPAGVLLALGSAHFRNGDRALAEHYWSEAVKVDGKLGEAWNNLAVVYLRGGRKKEAEDAVTNAERAGFRVNPRLKDDIRAMKSDARSLARDVAAVAGR
ncbi:MAG: tetratricopeptide repeat protein [Acidobacteria bacterium]|nr:tetratricopeptide repeat protein [Acidobacteriota bacterium]